MHVTLINMFPGMMLRKKGWSSERLNYVIRKSLGKSVGMIEIIPIERVSAWLRNRKAQKTIGTATGARQQKYNNINKSGMRV